MGSHERRAETLEDVKRYGLRKTDKGAYNSKSQENNIDSSVGLDKSKNLGEEDELGNVKEMDSSNRIGEIDHNVLSGLMTLCEKAARIEEEDGDMESTSREHKGDNVYCVGDFVWGKIKHHPWWPGQIYHPSDASDLALKIPQKDRYLVAYYGDGTFSWCYGSQLKPFEENFEQFSKDSNAKGFLNAVDAASEMVGRLVELGMSCSCVAGDSDEIGLIKPVAGNAGIKEGVIVPEDGINKLSIAQFEPAKIVARLRCFGQEIGEVNLLELTVLKSMLSAFYCAKGYSQLPAYHFPQNIVGLEDKKTGVAEENGDSFEGLPLQNRPALSDDKLYHRRKQKSIAEILATEGGAVLKRHKDDTDSGKLVSADRKGENVADDNYDDKLISLSMSRKKAKFSKSIVITDRSAPGGGDLKTDLSTVSRDGKEKETSTVQNEEEPQMVQSPRERKKSKYLSPPYTLPKRGGRDSELEFLKVIYSGDAHVGERLTKAANAIIGSPSSKNAGDEVFQNKDSEEDGDKNDKPDLSSPQIANQKPTLDKVNVNEVLSGVQSAALGLPPKSLDKNEEFFATYRDSVCNNGSNYNMASKGKPGRKRKSAGTESGSLGKGLQQIQHISPETKTQEANNEINGEKSVTPKSKKKRAGSGAKQTESKPSKKRIEKTEEKPSTFIAKEASAESGQKQADKKSVRKRNKKDNAEKEYLSPENKSDKTSIKQDEDKASAPESKQISAVSGEKQSKRKPRGKKIKKEEVKHETPKPKQPVDSAAKPKKVKKTNDGGASSAAVVLTFRSSAPFPTKSDLLADYSKFGPLNEEKTEVLHDAFHARVVFKKKSDGEKAFKQLVKTDTGDSGITYGLQYVSSDSGLHPSDSLQGKENDKSPENTISVQYIKQKLGMLTSMVENSEGTMSQEMKTNLENGMKDLLEKVKNMAGSSTS